MKLFTVWLLIISVATIVRYLTGTLTIHGSVFDVLLVSASVAGAWLAKRKAPSDKRPKEPKSETPSDV